MKRKSESLAQNPNNKKVYKYTTQLYGVTATTVETWKNPTFGCVWVGERVRTVLYKTCVHRPTYRVPTVMKFLEKF